MPPKPLGKLEVVDLRAYWADEARDFTPWLASTEGLALLGETVDLDLELVGQEQRVGPFKADILARETNADTEHLVVIENQLEKTNHDHLGKIITYGAGLQAATIIWVAAQFTDEHRQALDWLNENAGENLAFFGLQVELWRIGASAPAPQFKVVSSPNAWARAVRAEAPTHEVSETKQDQLQFWEELKAYSQAQGSPLAFRKPRPQHWYSLALGRSGFRLSLTINGFHKRVGCEVFIAKDPSKEAFELLKAEQAQIEAELGAPLEWQRLDNKKSSRIVLYLPNVVIDQPTQRAQAREWLHRTLAKFHTVFSSRVRQLALPDEGETAEGTED